MNYVAKIAGLAVLAASWIGIVGCDRDEHRHHGVVVAPADGYYDGGYYGDGYYYRHHDYDYDRGRYGYHIDRDGHRDFDHRDFDHNNADHHAIEHRGGEHHGGHR